jgi:hypothetical protein
MARQNWFCCLSLVFSMLVGLAIRVVAQSTANSREQLRQYVAQLQSDPSNSDLRENIIKLALTMRPAPSIPAAALEAEGAAEYAFRHASSKDDYAAAAKQYEKALLAAPWSAKDYFNLAICQEKAEEYDKAIANYNFYLLAVPDAKDHDDVLKKIGAMRYAAEHPPSAQSAVATSSPPPAPPPLTPEEQQRKLVQSLDGTCFSHTTEWGLRLYVIRSGWFWHTTNETRSRQWILETEICKISGLTCEGSSGGFRGVTITIDADGDTVTEDDHRYPSLTYARMSKCPTSLAASQY